MRLLTVAQPTAALLTVDNLVGHPVVNRRFPVTDRNFGPVVLVAGPLDRSLLGDAMLRSFIADSGQDIEELPTSGAVALATLVDAHPSAGACCAPWGTLAPAWFHLVLDDIRPLTRRARIPGRPGLSALDAKERAEVLTCL